MRRSAACRVAAIAALSALAACSPGLALVLHGGERQLGPTKRLDSDRHVLIFALDGAGYDQVMQAVGSGSMPHLASVLGAPGEDGLFAHAYSAPDAVSILPSTTIAAWSAIFTGAPPAENGVPGNEWFVREEMQFYAPIPVSVPETRDSLRAVTEGLVGNALRTPTLFEQVNVSSAVSLNDVYRGASVYTTVEPSTVAALVAHYVKGDLRTGPERHEVMAHLDEESVPKVIDSLNEHGVPGIQVVYFPGIDLFTHIAPEPLEMEVAYLETKIDALIGKVLDEYQKRGVLERTYVVVVSDHGHTPVLKDPLHALGSDGVDSFPAVVRRAGFRTRKFTLDPEPRDRNYQAVFAYQGAMAYLYLADRSTCPGHHDVCDWARPPRFRGDVLPVVRALYRASHAGRAFPDLHGTLDLVFARVPGVLPGKRSGAKAAPAVDRERSRELMVFDGQKLVRISTYLTAHPRPDLVDLDRRMRALSAGPYGNRAGDIVLLAPSGLDRPIEDRYYFSGPYCSWHGSASVQDSHIVLILAHPSMSGEELRGLMRQVAGEHPSQLDVTPLVRALLAAPEVARGERN